MEVVAQTPNGSVPPPFHNHDVREWSRIDNLTGVLERARFETDHWTANTNSSSHKYGKVVDSRARSNADGAVQQRARRQFEVFESSVPGARLQVIKSHTVSSSRWTTKTNAVGEDNDFTEHFGDLNLSLNPLDLSSQKSKATVGRSVGRRPPSRPRARDEPSINQVIPATENVRLHRVSRLCNQIHEPPVHQFQKYPIKPSIHDRECGDGPEINENNEKTNLTRTKSTSNDDVHLLTPEDKIKSVEDLEDLKQLQTWRRTSKLRRSLQLPKARTNASKLDDLPQNTGSVRKIREDLETGRRLSTALRGNNVDLEALDHILQSISGKSDSDRSSISSEPNEISFKKQKRNSFVTVESLQEVKGRLRRTSSPTQDIYKVEKDVEADDGIVTEINNVSIGDGLVTPTRVRSYMFGMEKDKKSMVGTGSLESKSKQSNGTLSYRNEDWYNRRKSYGFEQVHNHQETMTPKSKNKDLIESSTDSGICRSGEIVEAPTSNKSGTHNGLGPVCDNYEDKLFNVGSVKRYTSIFEKKRDYPSLQNGKGLDYGYFEPKDARNGFVQNLYEGGTILTNGETKRHSIAVDESKYVTKPTNNNYRRISLAVNDITPNELTQEASEDDFLAQNKKQKKVEFCKTEVHFAAESGRVNIVATDEKPPPTNNFRRRRRNSATLYDQLLVDANTNGLPVLHFGDSSYEKSLLGFNEQENLEPEPDTNTNTVTVSTNNSYQNYEENEDVQKEENEAPRGILKNKLIKPKPYLLGDDNFFTKPTNDDNQIWGVKLKPVPKSETLMWKSTVTLKNTLFEKQKNKNVFAPNPIGSEQDLSVNNGCDKIQIVTPRPLGSVNKFEENNRGFSTKINIGVGDATVVSDNDQLNGTKNGIWPRYSEQFKDAKKNILNKALVVRIGRDEISSHTICSKTSTIQNDPFNNTTTTKITIDLSPSPTQTKESTFNFLQVPPFKSTSLVLNTLNCENELPKKEVPEKLEVLRKLYEDWQSDSEADREVQLLMNKSEEERVKQVEQDNHSVVSGSWSKMRAFRHIKKSDELLQASIAKLQARAQVAKDFSNLHVQDELGNKSTFEDKLEKPKLVCRVPYSPVALRRSHQVKREDLKTAQKSEKLSSPFLVVQNVSDFENNTRTRNEETIWPRIKKEEPRVVSNVVRLKEKRPLTPIQMNFREKSSPIYERRSNSHYSCMKQTQINGNHVKLAENRISPSKSVLRNPSQSEMAYFGVSSSRNKEVKKMEEKSLKKVKPINGYLHKKSDPPIYENVNEYNKSKNQKEFDSSILDELTKAADQILQAVNGYAEESLKQELEDEKSNQKHEKLDTICETKSWKQQNGVRHKNAVVKTKLKSTSSTSSIESVTEIKKGHSNPRSSDSEKNKKKVNGEVASLKAATKARRLQRASSREALLQSHGSSSEDLPVAIEVPVRKPRLVRKTKTASNGADAMSKSLGHNKRRETATVGALPEIRHKTAVSTIRSTAEKTLNRERLQKMKLDEAKRKSKTESSKATVIIPKVRNVSNKEAINHRISTANIKKCNRYERSTTYKP